ncbi:hypothetical protein Tco_1329744, partial [Tanacetum coccineum]
MTKLSSLSSYNVNEAPKAEIETIGEPVKNDSDVGPYVKIAAVHCGPFPIKHINTWYGIDEEGVMEE